MIAQLAKKKRKPASPSWRMGETYIKINESWCYYYRAIDKYGATLDFMLSEHRGEETATRFFKKTDLSDYHQFLELLV